MRQLLAFMRKELLEQFRTGKLVLLLICFSLFGIMNPAIAKLTPWMMEMMSQQLAESGMQITAVEVDALTSWSQYFKNMPMALIIFLLLFSGIFTTEYQKGTLINVVTKGMKRWRVFASKMVVMLAVWTLGCLICYGITFAYNAYFWDNSVAHHVFFAAVCFYLFGMWLISVLGMASVFCNSSGTVMLALGAAFGVSYLLGLFPVLKEYVPSYLLQSAGMLIGNEKAASYLPAVFVAMALFAIESIISVLVFNKKNL